MKKILLVMALTLSSAIFQYNAEAKVIDEHIYIVPAENVNDDILENLKKKIPGYLPMSAKIIIDRPRAMPKNAYDSSSDKYSAEIVLEDLSQNFTLDIANENAVLITNAKLCTQDLAHITSLADTKARMCVVSLYSLRNEFHGLKTETKLFIDRACKEVVRGLGHVWGLSDCPSPRCVMYFSEDFQKMDNKRGRLCVNCDAKLSRLRAKPIMKVKLPTL